MKSFSFLLSISLLIGLVSPQFGCRKLDPSGVYHGNQKYFAADQALRVAYTALHSFIQWEYDNRDALRKSNPGAEKLANKIRRNADKWFAAAFRARDRYLVDPSALNGSTLTSSIKVIDSVVAETLVYAK
jgi:hypothetical protein